MSAYEPGTVAVATVRGVLNVRVMSYAYEDGVGWASAVEAAGFADHADHVVTDVRPLVVLDLKQADPEDLKKSIAEGYLTVAQARDLNLQIEAQTKPPRIPEPGLWGVVSAKVFGSDRVLEYLHTPDGLWYCTIGSAQRLWSELINPTLVREGVES